MFSFKNGKSTFRTETSFALVLYSQQAVKNNHHVRARKHTRARFNKDKMKSKTPWMSENVTLKLAHIVFRRSSFWKQVCFLSNSVHMLTFKEHLHSFITRFSAPPRLHQKTGHLPRVDHFQVRSAVLSNLLGSGEHVDNIPYLLVACSIPL